MAIKEETYYTQGDSSYYVLKLFKDKAICIHYSFHHRKYHLEAVPLSVFEDCSYKEDADDWVEDAVI